MVAMGAVSSSPRWAEADVSNVHICALMEEEVNHGNWNMRGAVSIYILYSVLSVFLFFHYSFFILWSSHVKVERHSCYRELSQQLNKSQNSEFIIKQITCLIK